MAEDTFYAASEPIEADDDRLLTVGVRLPAADWPSLVPAGAELAALRTEVALLRGNAHRYVSQALRDAKEIAALRAELRAFRPDPPASDGGIPLRALRASEPRLPWMPGAYDPS